jgi:hypothetical protein
MNNAPKWVTCPCNHCSGSIEFDASDFEKYEGRSAECPHCRMETVVFVPPTVKPSLPPLPPIQPLPPLPPTQRQPKRPWTTLTVIGIALVAVVVVGPCLLIGGLGWLVCVWPLLLIGLIGLAVGLIIVGVLGMGLLFSRLMKEQLK